MQSRTFLITGASKGIGLAIAQRFAASGHTVVGLARSPVDNFPGVLECVDLGDPNATALALEQLTSRHNFDGIVNNVGLVKPQRLGEITLPALSEVLSLNLIPAVQATQAIMPGMVERHWGRVVNISSLTILGTPERSAYAAAKAALTSFARTWALELATTGITVNAVAPGPTETELFRTNNPPGSPGEQRYLAGVPMGRFGHPDEIAAAVAFLMSEEAAFITGQTLHVDGGASIGKRAF